MEKQSWDLKSKKFALVILAIAMSYVLVWKGKVEPDKWMEFLKWIIGIYIFGNVGQKIGLKMGGRNDKS
ncbi:MAG: hypothetical protein DRO18_03670 [Thermoprotei archaeon]|nr:MAG: hypothetical protein DRO18_03670 [Thermoprotei archaeon]